MNNVIDIIKTQFWFNNLNNQPNREFFNNIDDIVDQLLENCCNRRELTSNEEHLNQNII